MQGLFNNRLAFFRVILVSLSLFTVPTWAQSDSLVDNLEQDEAYYRQELIRIKTFVRGNVLGLAELMLKQQGPPRVLEKQWINWQKQLWAIYEYSHDWQKLYQATKDVEYVSDEFTQLAIEKNIRAQIQLGQTKQARVQLRQQILRYKSDPIVSRQLRRLLVASFLKQGLLPDATIAASIFQREYRVDDESWLRTIAEIHVGLQQWQQAIDILAPLSQPESRLLRLYAHAKNQSLPLNTILADGKQLITEIEENNLFAIRDYQVLAVMIDATQTANQTDYSEQEISLLERYLALSTLHSTVNNTSPYPVFSVEDLLAAYTQNAIELGRENQWLDGDYSAYIQYVERLVPTKLLTRRIIFGYLLQHIHQQEQQQALQNRYINTLIASEDIRLVPILFGSDKAYDEVEFQDGVGISLSNLALQQQNFNLAAWVNRRINTLPEGIPQQDWLMNNARVAIIAGDYQLGTQALLDWFSVVTEPSDKQLNQVLQPIFDLQTANQHQQAIGLLQHISSLPLSSRYRREVAFWLAQSYFDSEQYIQAADQFLLSALQKDKGLDQWGQSARFQAAESLLAANLTGDARTLFNDLYERTTDPSFKTRLLQKLQQISLIESSL